MTMPPVRWALEYRDIIRRLQRLIHHLLNHLEGWIGGSNAQEEGWESYWGKDTAVGTLVKLNQVQRSLFEQEQHISSIIGDEEEPQAEQPEELGISEWEMLEEAVKRYRNMAKIDPSEG